MAETFAKTRFYIPPFPRALFIPDARSYCSQVQKFFLYTPCIFMLIYRRHREIVTAPSRADQLWEQIKNEKIGHRRRPLGRHFRYYAGQGRQT
ncbi:hypothetical protein FLX27_27425 [Agrobacterium tumefaciens]|nr:hypothetical protein FLX27_27425 [Agrobacterium tumefaciens]